MSLDALGGVLEGPGGQGAMDLIAYGCSGGIPGECFLWFLRRFYSVSCDMDLIDLCLLLLLGHFYSKSRYMRFSSSSGCASVPFCFLEY